MPDTTNMNGDVSTSSSDATVITMPRPCHVGVLTITGSVDGSVGRFAVDAEAVNATTNSAIPATGVPLFLKSLTGMRSLSLTANYTGCTYTFADLVRSGVQG